ncbi:RNA methyltransferase [Peptococcaceae bacterium SCADC1_2_3]|nr:RNA methyltransferase [Peptococcaceae bacterium SCADC1_2_3]KFI34560.1 RNA methyltransferase [Peptococcaceae bacterium SCADC1_2_3]KFI35803.1 RNA methyltransferase [Peptococcaceae bacterium SCADC1_2_3]KFI37259.1 RNA methyltransferase [Peptococcaceae bacterium SCADC1_2_3]HBQ28206.1 23S rRNA (guanosine(2251)-2'-O)-methyltransferase RlmB [Desulfotomaculum sp.]
MRHTRKTEDIIPGRNAVIEALRANRPINKLLVAKSTSFEGSLRKLIFLAREKYIPVQLVEQMYLDKMFPGGAHQGVVALASAKEYVTIEHILAETKEKNPLLLFLDEITDPRNFGAIVRTAVAAGVHGVIIPRHRTAPVTPAVAKAAAGALEYALIARVANLTQTIMYVQQHGLWVVGADAAAKDVFWDATLTGPLALVVGGESKGLGRLVRQKCDLLVRLPMTEKASSLNASVAAALLIYEVLRQRRSMKQ